MADIKVKKYASKEEELEDKILGLESEINEILEVLYKTSPKHYDWIKANFPNWRNVNEGTI